MVRKQTMAAKRFCDYCYPKTKQLGSSFQQVFDEYGCLEAVDVEFNDENKRFTVQAKKQRPLLVDELNKDSSWILEPCTPVLPLGNPENLSHEIYPPIHMQDYYKDTMVHNAQDSSKSRRPVYNIKRHMRNLASDHPDVYQPTYDRLIGNESPVVISGKRGRKTMQGKSFNFDPTMLDTPASLLKDLLMEEISEQTKSFVFNEDYTGGVLSMIPISRNPYEHGVLVLPSSSLDGVSLKPFSVVTDSLNVENEGGFA
uniref:Uncharacterized protein n=1 Tax=Ciona savignyi TaxID=51511 RepID=H2YMQ6_CIOSA